MGLVSGLWLAVLGILGASNLIIARKPDAKELIAKLAPYQGWIGAVSALWGAWGIVIARFSGPLRASVALTRFLGDEVVELLLRLGHLAQASCTGDHLVVTDYRRRKESAGADS